MDFDRNKILSRSDIDELEAAYKQANAGNPAKRGYAPELVRGVGLRCRLGFHRWSKWWISREGELVQGGSRVGFYQDQERICLECLRSQMQHGSCP